MIIRVSIVLLSISLLNPLYAESFTTSFGQAFVKVKAGSFLMGTKDFDLLAKEVDAEVLEGLKKELPAHKVTISKNFYMATTEVTQGQWFDIMGFKPGKEKRWLREDWKDIPVSRVTWEDTKEFIESVNDLSDDYTFRLPTEAEWEYAARAGTTGLRPFDFKDMAIYAWFKDSSDKKPMPVASLKPNAWGLYDMIGNVWEWVEDSYDAEYYKSSPEKDPKGGELSSRKTMKGGSYLCTTERVRVGIRGSYVKHKSLSVLGFRLVAEKK